MVEAYEELLDDFIDRFFKGTSPDEVSALAKLDPLNIIPTINVVSVLNGKTIPVTITIAPWVRLACKGCQSLKRFGPIEITSASNNKGESLRFY